MNSPAEEPTRNPGYLLLSNPESKMFATGVPFFRKALSAGQYIPRSSAPPTVCVGMPVRLRQRGPAHRHEPASPAQRPLRSQPGPPCRCRHRSQSLRRPHDIRHAQERARHPLDHHALPILPHRSHGYNRSSADQSTPRHCNLGAKKTLLAIRIRVCQTLVATRRPRPPLCRGKEVVQPT